MKILILLVFFSSILLIFSELPAQNFSPQAQAVLNRLSPDQRAMVLKEADRLQGGNKVTAVNKTDLFTNKGSSTDINIEEQVETLLGQQDKLI